MTNSIENKFTVGVCETQPLVVAGLRSVIQSSRDFMLLDPVRSLDEATRLIITCSPRVMILDKAFGAPAVSEFVDRLRDRVPVNFVVWSASMTEPEALRFLKVGAKGIIRKTAEPATILACLEAVAAGGTWMEDTLFHGGRVHGRGASELTAREQQVLELVERGLRNKEIANELGIRPGTVKIHLKHIFEKTGVRGRYGLALTGLQQRTTMAFATA